MHTPLAAGAFAEGPLGPAALGHRPQAQAAHVPRSLRLGLEVWPAPPGLVFRRRQGLCARRTQVALVQESGVSLAWRDMSPWASPAPSRLATVLPGAWALPVWREGHSEAGARPEGGAAVGDWAGAG